jgi:hypothetical protein
MTRAHSSDHRSKKEGIAGCRPGGLRTEDSDGDMVYLRPGAAEVDAVYLAHHDGGDIEILAESVAQMRETLTLRGSQT